jgi:hypothetical protein
MTNHSSLCVLSYFHHLALFADAVGCDRDAALHTCTPAITNCSVAAVMSPIQSDCKHQWSCIVTSVNQVLHVLTSQGAVNDSVKMWLLSSTAASASAIY